jgi:ribosomal protein S27AE
MLQIDEEKYNIDFNLELEGMVSVDSAYFHVPMKSKRCNRMTTHAVKSDKLKDFQELMSSILPEVIDKDKANNLRNAVSSGFYGLSVSVTYHMPRSDYMGSDTTNYIKAYEDCLGNSLSIDDKYNILFRAEKVMSGSDLWTVNTQVSLKPRNYVFIGSENTYCQHCKHDTQSIIDGSKIICSNCNDTKFYIVDNTTVSSNYKDVCPCCGGNLSVTAEHRYKCEKCNVFYVEL